MIEKKHIIAIDFILVVGSLLLIAGIVGYTQPLAIAPLNGFETTDTAVLFEFEKAEVILIDDNPDFSSPEEIYAKNDLVINLKPGKYYWKLFGVGNSEVREITIVSEVDLKIRQAEDSDSYELVNAGNTLLNIDIYNNSELTNKIVLDVDRSREVSGTKFIGREHE